MFHEAPMFDVLFEDTSINITEDHDIAFPFYTLAVTDLDNDGALTYDIVSQPSGSQFSLTDNTIITSKAFDAETETSYTLIFRYVNMVTVY